MRKLSASSVLLLVVLLVGGGSCDPQEGYFYPRPTPQCLPQVFTETVTDYATETLNHFFTDVNTVYLTDFITSTVVNPGAYHLHRVCLHSLPSVHALPPPPSFDEHEGYRYKRKLNEETAKKSASEAKVSSKST
uniref:Uncharacterized protein n=1 Tax=Anopheles coluzzii TaxID=1518534 RepID=A0A8W7PY45_ANOCL